MKVAALFIVAPALVACASTAGDPLQSRVRELVEETTTLSTEAKAFAELEKLGEPGVPYLVAHLKDIRPLPEQAISLVNNFPGAFEGLRHYSPDTVHDALSAILNQITGQNFEFVYNGATPEQRQRNASAWVKWCASKYAEKATTCEHGI